MHARKRLRAQEQTTVSLSKAFRVALDFLCDLYSCDRSPFLEELIRESVQEIPARLPGYATGMAHAFFVDALRKKTQPGTDPLSRSMLIRGDYNKHLQQPLMTREEIREKLSHPQRTKRVDFRSYFPRSKKRRDAMTRTASGDAFYPDPPLIDTPPALETLVRSQAGLTSLLELIKEAHNCRAILAEMVFQGMEVMRQTCRSLAAEISKLEREDATNIARISKLSKKGVQPQTIEFALNARPRLKKLLEQEETESKAKKSASKTKDYNVSKHAKPNRRTPSISCLHPQLPT